MCVSVLLCVVGGAEGDAVCLIHEGWEKRKREKGKVIDEDADDSNDQAATGTQR